MILTSNDQDNRYSYGVTFNGVHSTEYGLDVEFGKEIGLPAKKKITVEVPYSSKIIDLSEVYGDQVYEEREIKIPFHVMDRETMTKERLYRLWQQAINWLESPSHKVPLIDDVDSEWHYLAEVESAPTWEEFKTAHGTLTVTFKAYPFRIKNFAEGNDIWDTFDFENDIAQFMEYEVTDSRVIRLFNFGIGSVSPIVKTTGIMQVSYDDEMFELNSGDNEIALELHPGENDILATGTGQIQFEFYREVI